MIQENRIFIWLAQKQLRTDFIEWAKRNNIDRYSHSTLSRAMERQYLGRPLTARQRGIEEVAKKYREGLESLATQLQNLADTSDKAGHALSAQK